MVSLSYNQQHPHHCPHPLLPSIFKPVSHQTISVIHLIGNKGQFYMETGSFIQSKCSAQVFRQREILRLGRIRKQALRLEAAWFSFSGEREGHISCVSSCSGALWQSVGLRSSVLWGGVSQHNACSVSFLILQSGESLTPPSTKSQDWKVKGVDRKTICSEMPKH